MVGTTSSTSDREDGTHSAPPRLLLVDDLEDNRIPLARRLGRSGYLVVEASTGPDALAQLSTQAFDLVLLDINMPDMDGFEVLTRIGERHSAADLPVIMITLRDARSDIVEAIRLGANDYVVKPVDFPAAEARIRGQVERARALARARLGAPAREELVQALGKALREAQSNARATSEFLANMSHEIRTPLNGILGLARALAETTGEPASRKMACTIVESAGALERLLSDALDLSRVEAGKLEVRSEPFNLSALVDRVIGLFAPAAAEKALSLRLDCRLAPGLVVGDGLRLQQILTNLVSNAVKFTAEGEVVLAVKRSGRFVSFEVRDTGIGFDPARATELFGRFEQADSGIAEKFGGSGLGLAISRSLAELMGGRLSAVSVPSRGSVFTLTLPLPKTAAPAASALPAQGTSAAPLRILAADDHATNRQVLELILAPTGADLVLVGDGAQALEALTAETFDLVLMDVQMPVLDGLSALRAFRSREAALGLGRTPVLALSAHASPEHRRMSLEAGADGHVTKPIHPAALLQSIEAALQAAQLEAATGCATPPPGPSARGVEEAS